MRQAIDLTAEGEPVAVLVLELEGLRAVIDQDGYPEGDQVLAVLAERLGELTGPGVTLAHLRPGVFAAVVPAGFHEAEQLAGAYLAAVRRPVDRPGRSIALRASVGISGAVPETGRSVEGAAAGIGRLVQDAESAAALAKDEGGSGVAFAAAEMRLAQRRQAQLESLIRSALDRNDVGIAYQPVFDLTTGSVVSAEALLRLRDSRGRQVPPLEVVHAAEASGLIVELGSRVMQLAAEQVAQWWHDLGVLVPVAVNVSALQLAKETFTDEVRRALALAQVPPRALSLELTESVLLKSGSAGMEQLRVLSREGIRLAIDDFGTGYASLTYLRDLPATILKIDRSFVEGIPDDLGATAIVAGVIGLARNFGMECIAEGIETEVQREYLAERAVMGQGFLLARPADGATVGRQIAAHGALSLAGGAEALSASEARDAAAHRRDRAGEDRDELGDQRDRVGDLRDDAGDHRDHLADQRDRAGDQRDDAADQRDELAEHRDRLGSSRDAVAARREQQAEEAETRAAPAGVTRIDQLASARRAASSDRRFALIDRLAGARERAMAGRDRSRARTDRGAGGKERAQAELDRNIASADRGLGAGERAQCGGDRNTAQADRGAAARERDSSSLDALTGAYVRGAGLAELVREVARAHRGEQELVLAFLDVDQLKSVNDSLGHAAGDMVLRAVADALKAHLRSYDLIVRYGGDEFLCVMTGLTLDAATVRLSQANSVLRAMSPPASFTAGLVQMLDGETPDALIARADAAFYARRHQRDSRSAEPSPGA